MLMIQSFYILLLLSLTTFYQKLIIIIIMHTGSGVITVQIKFAFCFERTIGSIVFISSD